MKKTDETESIPGTDEAENTTETGEMENTPETEGKEDTPETETEGKEGTPETEETKDTPETEGKEGTPETEEKEDTPETEGIKDIGGIIGREGEEDVSGADGIVTVSGGNGTAGGIEPKAGFYTLAIAGAVILVMALLWVLFRKKVKKQADRTQAPEPSPNAGQIQTEEIMIEEQIYRVGKLHCIGRRESQQDSFAVSDVEDRALCEEKGVIVIVADGMGGLSDGDKISSMTTLSFFRHFHERPVQGDAGNELLQMLREANGEVNRYLGAKTGQCGSTLVAGIVKDRKCHWISVGDSHIYLYKNGGLIQLNREHVYREELDAKAANGEISREEAMKNPQRGALTSYIGMGRIEKVDRNQEPLVLYPGDRLLFMTDGVFGTLSEAQIAEAMRYPMEESIRLMDESIRAVGKPKQDNYTAVILECR